MIEPHKPPFAAWLEGMMRERALSQAALARDLGVPDTQVSRWRRGQVIPTVQSLQLIADTLRVPRAALDRLAGYPVEEEHVAPLAHGPGGADTPEGAAEIARLVHLLQGVPRELWRPYLDGCEALARTLSAAHEVMRPTVQEQADAARDDPSTRQEFFPALPLPPRVPR